MRYIIGSFAVALTVAMVGCGGSGLTSSLPQQTNTKAPTAARSLPFALGAHSILPAAANAASVKTMCAKPTDPSSAACFATVRVDSALTGAFPDAVYGLTPNDISSLYNYGLPGQQGSNGSDKTVAIVVAGDYALAESDLAVYRAKFGLPACTTANHCLSKIGAAAVSGSSEEGNGWSISAHPTTTTGIGWAAETDADTEMVSAVCPNCHIVIAEAASDKIGDLTAAVQAAVNANVSIVNASFGVPESPSDLSFTSVYENPQNIKIVAASGDWGYGVYYPASDPKVVAVGGTSLNIWGSTMINETAWSGTGSGCSSIFSRPSWQQQQWWNSCQNRTVVDVAAVADPATGVAVYDSSLFGSTGAWSIFGGTSVSSPIIASVYALSGDVRSSVGASKLYQNTWALLGVTSGSNGFCMQQYLCTAMPGYNGPTGNGVPHWLSGF